ncbi:MAG: 50S ribosomal protein L9 [Patescibacteria group bacterium]
MKIILLQDIPKIGKKNDVKEVSEGYVRNFLIPKSLAKIAAEEDIKKIEKLKEEKLKEEKTLISALEAIAKKYNNKEYHFYPEMGDSGEIFNPINREQIKNAFIISLNSTPQELKNYISENLRVDLAKSLKTLGEHIIPINLGRNIRFNAKIILNRDGIKS